MQKEFHSDLLRVFIKNTRGEMGSTAARAVHDKILELQAKKEELNILFAAAPSQKEMLTVLSSYKDIFWDRINALHMDEYVNLDENAPQRFGNFLRKAIFEKVPFRSVFYLNGNAENLDAECERYAALLDKHPLDIACIGIGENGHIAFNDPHVADFNDPKRIKCVELDMRCRQQQVNDHCFEDISQVPEKALTLTIPVICSAKHIVCVVPAITKAAAVKSTVEGPIGEYCPATVLRNHADAALYLDSDSASKLELWAN